eukprot:CAMPEP_0182418696 /NCGR_PEP_ID=MMETSP1167-20130531/3066_1 /TAXON_ID=2988 /ORGANISM="Mallomonas Sp, Strain CCMP3275" /LENGTH=177 /DNA_ID=CAMNT_0024593009 /DNA_START=93 /DNA_END=623 /DNA_ORIENTATION=+
MTIEQCRKRARVWDPLLSPVWKSRSPSGSGNSSEDINKANQLLEAYARGSPIAKKKDNPYARKENPFAMKSPYTAQPFSIRYVDEKPDTLSGSKPSAACKQFCGKIRKNSDSGPSFSHLIGERDVTSEDDSNNASNSDLKYNRVKSLSINTKHEYFNPVPVISRPESYVDDEYGFEW